MSVRRLGRGPAVGGVLALGLALFALTLPTWVRGLARTTAATQEVAVSGSSAAPGVASAGLVIAVAGLVLALSGRVTRVLAILAVVGGGGLAGVSALQLLADPTTALLPAAAAVSGVARLEGDPEVTAFAVVAVVVAGATVLTGLALPFLLGRWQRVGRRYERGGEAAAVDAGPEPSTRRRAMDDWDAISHGRDPSADGSADAEDPGPMP